jgi:threonine aldolase
MLQAIAQTTLLDDVFTEDPTTNSLESFIADLTGKPAALFVLSGSMGNQVAIRAHLGAPPNGIVCDTRCHIIQYEAGGVASLSGAMVQPIVPANKKYITLEEVKEHAVLWDNVHACPTKIVELENTLNGTIMPLSEVRRIAAWARENDLLVHMDGARLWEAVAAGAGTLREFCAEVDSVSLCFSKGLGAPIGSIIAGSEKFIKRARWVRKSIGGGLRQAGVVAAPARVAVEETFLGGKLKASHVMAKRVEKMWVDMGGKMLYPVDTNMAWLDLAAHGLSEDELITLAAKYGLKTGGGRLVIHYQISEEAVTKLEQVFAEVLKGKKGGAKKRRAEVSAEELKLEGVE